MEAQQVSLFDEQPRIDRKSNVYPIAKHPRYNSAPDEKNAARTISENHTSQPVRNVEQLQQIEDALLSSSPKYGLRNKTIFVFGILTGRRCGDILSLRVGDVWDTERRTVRESFVVHEEKTNKHPTIWINEDLSPVLDAYIATLKNKQSDAPLFPSRKVGVAKKKERLLNDDGCLTTGSFAKIMRQAGDALGLSHFSTHSMRKTFGYTFYMQFVGQTIEERYGALELLQLLFGHSSALITLRYIGITDDIMRNAFRELKMYDRDWER